MSLLSVFLGREICGTPDWPGCSNFGQYDAVMNSDDIEAFVDKTAEEFLKDELALMPAGFRAISVPGDGNCLAHAVSKSQIGIELLYHALRQEMQNELRSHKDWYWKKCIPFFDEESATEFIEGAAVEAVPSDDTGSAGCVGMAEFLGPIHIHAMANVLRRPIVLMAARSMWEQSLSGVYLPEREEPAHWTTENHEAVLAAARAAVEDTLFESSNICRPFQDWRRKLSSCKILNPWKDAAPEEKFKESAGIGALCDELLELLTTHLPVVNANELAGKLWKTYQAINAMRLRSPIYIAWASRALAHFVCLLPSAPGGTLAEAKLPIARNAMPQRDGELVVLGESESGVSREVTARLYLEGGEFAVRGHTWPNKEQFIAKLEEFWRKEHPTEDFKDSVLEKGWNILLPNLLNNVLDIAQLFKSLNVEDDDDPVWLRVGRTRLLVPKRVESLTYRLPYLTNLLSQASDRMRPIWITSPDASSIMTQGEDFRIEWGTISRIAAMVQKKTGLKLDEQMVEIGWMLAGTGNFSPNIAKSVPFHTRSHVWTIPASFRPGKYWIAVRLIPFDETLMEGAGPPQGSFTVVAKDAKKEVSVIEGSEKCDHSEVQDWEYFEHGEWHLMLPELCATLSRAQHRADTRQIQVQIDGCFAEVDLDQMKMTLGVNTVPIRMVGDFEVNADSLATLVDMGFEEDLARQALENCNNDVDMATLWLTDGPVDETSPLCSRADSGRSSSAQPDLEPDPIDELDNDNIPLPLQRVLSREVSGGLRAADTTSGMLKSASVIREIDSSVIPVRELRLATPGKRMPKLDEDYLHTLEKEAKAWELKGESLWQKVEEEMRSHADKAPPRPSLQRVKTDVGMLAQPSALCRTTSAPAVLSGLNHHQWASLFHQARSLYKTGR
mmetsp:Transcript_7018/g.11116  ORF Transcript_7018/g.11116 Transcript_7018/m.11116 type:complete len:897 (+) Transcript_7018:78-2768(+)